MAPAKGSSLSAAHRAKISAARREQNKGIPKTPEHRRKISLSMSGRVDGWPDEARAASAAKRTEKRARRQKLFDRLNRWEAAELLKHQKVEIAKLNLITSPTIQMLFDRKYAKARELSPQELSRLWVATAKQHGMYRTRSKNSMLNAKVFTVLRTWLGDLCVYPERYFRALCSRAQYSQFRGSRWHPHVSALCSSHFFKLYIEWEERLRSRDEGWIELMKETGVSRLPAKVQDQMLESAECLMSMSIAVAETIDIWTERYFVELSPYLLFFMPSAQKYIATGHGTHEQRRVFAALNRDDKLRAKYKPFYDAATHYFKIAEISQEKQKMNKEKIQRSLREQYDAAVEAAGIRLDLVDPNAL